MLRTADKYKNDRGYILLMVVVMMLVMAVMAFGMNRRAGMQAKMAANQTRSSQIHLGQIAALEEAAWTLNRNPGWRTSDAGEKYVFAGIEYNRKVLDASSYSDVVTVTVSTPGGSKELSTSFRLIPETVISYLIADTENHRIRKVDIATGLITTFAGNGSPGYSGDDGPATDASINYPKGLCADQSGNVFIADTLNHRIRKVDLEGTITPFAGNGSSGYSGNGGPATAASMDEPHGVAVDGLGNVYIADTKNHRIRMVDTSNIMIPFAGSGNNNYQESTDEDVLATTASLNEPNGVYVDASGNVFIADTENCMIRKVDASTNLIRRVAGAVSGGNPSCGYSGDGGQATLAQLNKPRSVYVDTNDNIYIADDDNHRIRKVAPDGIITTIAGNGVGGYGGDGGPATSALLYNPKGVWVDEEGNVLIADTENNRLRKIGVSPEDIGTVAGDGSAGYS